MNFNPDILQASQSLYPKLPSTQPPHPPTSSTTQLYLCPNTASPSPCWPNGEPKIPPFIIHNHHSPCLINSPFQISQIQPLYSIPALMVSVQILIPDLKPSKVCGSALCYTISNPLPTLLPELTF